MTRSEGGSKQSMGGRRRLLRWVMVGGTVLGLALLGGIGRVRVTVDAEFLQRRINRALGEGVTQHYRAEVGGVQWGLLLQSLHIEDIEVRLESLASTHQKEGKESSQRRYRVTVPTIRLRGIQPWSLLWRRILILDSVRVQEPVVRVRERKNTETSPREDPFAATPDDQKRSLRGVRVHRLILDGGIISVDRGGGLPQDSLWGLTARLDSLSTDSSVLRHPRRYLPRRLSQGGFTGYRRRIPKEMYALRAGPSRLSRGDSTLVVEKVRLEPTVSDSVFMHRHEYRTNRVRAGVQRIEVEGFALQRFVEKGALLADTLRFDSLQVGVYRDNHRPERPEKPPPPMPHEVVRDLERRVRIGTIRVQDSDVRYVKRAEGAPRSGSVSFEDLWASFYNVTNDAARMSTASPMAVRVRTLVNGGGQLRATLRLPLLSPHLSLSFQGHLGPMDARAFNETFVNLGGVRIEAGQVDSLWFEVAVDQGRASGALRSVYRNLEIETLDRSTGARGLRNRLKTFIVDGMALRSSNVPGANSFHIGQIRHRHRPGDSFFKFLWLSLRSGIYSLVGIDRLPGKGG